MDALPEFRIISPTTLTEAIAARAGNPNAMPLGGGTDLVVNIRRGIVAPPVLIDMNRVQELHAIHADENSIELGASIRLSEIAQHPAINKHYPVLAQAAAHIAGPTHRNMGTVGGNLCLDTRCIFYNQSEWWRSFTSDSLGRTFR
jgi:4-hydroxybenzoyl-CoA reductase subunit beta